MNFKQHRILMESEAVSDGPAFATLTALVYYADTETAQSNPGVRQIAQSARLTEEVVQRTIISLLKSGHISVVQQGGGRGKTTVYRVHIR